MKKQLIECVPNVSEGRNRETVEAIAAEIVSVPGVALLHVDRGESANRTVFTYAGEPEAVVGASFRMIRRSLELIDMRRHRGEHPRIGAVDVFPFIPLANITAEETLVYARRLAERVGTELGVPVYGYEGMASVPQRRLLADCRKGEYEGLRVKLADPLWRPDYGPSEWSDGVARGGAVVMGVRDLLLAVNFSLTTASVETASAIAKALREKTHGPFSMPGVRAIGWYMEQYGFAQCSCNIVDRRIAPLHRVWDRVNELAALHGTDVRGTEVIGLLPLDVLLSAGQYFASKEGLAELPEAEAVALAVRMMKLDDLAPYDPQMRIIEYLLKKAAVL